MYKRIYDGYDKKSVEFLYNLVKRMEEGVPYAELKEYFDDDARVIAGWLESFYYIGTLNFPYMEREGWEEGEGETVCDGSFIEKDGQLWYSGYNYYHGQGGKAEVLVLDNDLIQLI